MSDPDPRPIEDHEYVWSIAGRCVRCQRTEDVHPKYDRRPDAECAVDHRSILPKMLIGDGGLQWSSCPQCGVMIEPKLATGDFTGKPDGRGRGDMTKRQAETMHSIAMQQDFLRWLDAGRPPMAEWFKHD